MKTTVDSSAAWTAPDALASPEAERETSVLIGIHSAEPSLSM